MRWPPWRKEPDVPSDEARRALERERRLRREAEAKWDRIDSAADRLLNHAENNHFSEIILGAMRRKHL